MVYFGPFESGTLLMASLLPFWGRHHLNNKNESIQGRNYIWHILALLLQAPDECHFCPFVVGTLQ